MPTASTSPSAWRLTFAYEGNQAVFLSKERLAMMVPGTDPLSGYDGQFGYWVELRDAAGKVIYRVVLHNPMPQYHEIHASDGRHTFTAKDEPRGRFDVLLPAVAQASTAILFGTPPPAPQAIGSYDEERARAPVPRVGTQAAHQLVSVNLEATRP